MYQDCANLIQRSGRFTECKIYIHNKFLKNETNNNLNVSFNEFTALLDKRDIIQ